MQRWLLALGPGLAVFLTLALAAYVWKNRKTIPGGGTMVGLMAALCVWSLGAVADVFVRSPELALRFSQIQYMGITACVPLWWSFVDRYLNPSNAPGRNECRLLLWTIPVFVFLMALTNGLHGLVWREIGMQMSRVGQIVVYRHGPVAYLFFVYAYLVILTTAFRLFRSARLSRFLHKRQALLLIGATLIPLLTNAFYLAGGWMGEVLTDITPLAFVVSGALLIANIQKYQFLDVGRIAYDALFHDLDFGTLVVDNQGRLVDCNEASCRLLRLEPPRDNAPQLDVWLKDRPEMLTWITGDKRELHICGAEKNDRCLLVRHMPLTNKHRSRGVKDLVILMDITESCRIEVQRRRKTEEAAQDHKMESVARLAGGVAHDFNNMLQGIIGFSDLLLARIPADSDLRDDIREIRTVARRAGALTGQLLSFSRRQIVVPSEVRLPDMLHEMRDTLQEISGPGIQINLRIAKTVPPVKGDSGQLSQAVLHMVSNAVEAMPDKGGKLTIALQPVKIELSEISIYGHEARAGDFVCLSIRDSGHGIDRENLSNIFEPFFTTRENQNKNGMGLAVAYGIVKQHQGWIDVWSEPGQGSLFLIYLPEAEATPASEMEPADEPVDLQGHGRCILLVEDELTVRLLALRTLCDAGYRVIDTGGVAEAMTAFEDRMDSIDLVFSDVELQDGNGVDLAAWMRTRKPEIPILLTSGYTDDRARWASIQEMNLRLLVKPYSLDELLKTLQSELQSGS